MIPEGPNVPKPEPGRTRLIDEISELIELFVEFVRQETGLAVRDKVVRPLQKLGLTIAAAWAAATFFVLGMSFIAVGLFIMLGQWIGYAWALLAIGGVLVIGAGIFTIVKVRNLQ